ncbi:hypothetical protein N7478_007263 [Penicillium angulare]|uniref:uncharacterized protein n=1 Tax=Penicillium angulare TaxID=116970 RepID=UPI002540FA76|nr:uncharacterized protein N7478_007263 [Penicillium angulare]KAJ5281891.1 hypothetical protein N7478_007263 [Penicillium angulare]
MGNTSSSQKISSQDRAILDLKNQRDKLKQYRKRITVLTDRETEIAKECLAQNDRRRALLALRRKKYQESLLDKTDGQLAQLEQIASQVEFALVQKDVMFGLQQGTEVLKAINKEMGGIEGVERLMGETEDARAYQEEISQMLEGNLTNQDEEDVEEELLALQRQVSKPKVATPNLPNVPNNALPTPEETEVENPEEPTRTKTKTRTPALAA